MSVTWQFPSTLAAYARDVGGRADDEKAAVATAATAATAATEAAVRSASFDGAIVEVLVSFWDRTTSRSTVRQY